jgi:putative cell wall-binding protein
LPWDTADVIGDLGIRNGVVAGGVGAVSSSVKSEIDSHLAANGGSASLRWSGADRYATAAQIAEQGTATMVNDYAFVGIATGTNYPDALAGGVASGMESGVMLLTAPDNLSSPASSALQAHAGEVAEVELFGGTGALSTSIETAVGQIIY